MGEKYSYDFERVLMKRYCRVKIIDLIYRFNPQVKYFTCETRINNGFDWIQAINRVWCGLLI